ncbi:MAG: MFS transporter [Pseudomonadota bacterium]
MIRPLHIVLATLMIDAIGIGIVFPILPDLMERVGAGDAAEGSVWGGLLMAAYAGAQFLFAPVLGGLSDAHGRKPILVAALVLLAVDYVVMALAGTFWLLLLGRTLAGMAGATYVTATAYIADISKPEDRAANFGLIGAAFGLGFVLGPVIGGLAATIHVTAPFWIAAGITALGAVAAIFVLPESLDTAKRRPFARSDLNPFGVIVNAFHLPNLAVPLSLIFAFEFANMVYPTLWAFWLTALLDWGPAAIGLSLAVYGVGVAITQGLLIRPLINQFGEGGALWIGLGAAILAFGGYGFAGSAWLVFALLPLACLSDIVPAVMTAMTANRVGEDRQGVVQGVIASLAAVAAIAAPVAMTAVFRATADDRGVFLPGAAFLFSGGLVLLMLPFLPRLIAPAARREPG